MAKEKKSSSKKKTSEKAKVIYDVFHEEYKGNDVIAIYEVDKKGNKMKEYPLISMGKKKWEVVMKHRDKVKELLKGLN